MQSLKIFSIILLGVYIIIFLGFCRKSGSTLKTMLLSSLSGVMVLTLINILSNLTGVSVPFNLYTFLGSSVFGIPGVVGMLILRLFF